MTIPAEQLNTFKPGVLQITSLRVAMQNASAARTRHRRLTDVRMQFNTVGEILKGWDAGWRQQRSQHANGDRNKRL